MRRIHPIAMQVVSDWLVRTLLSASLVATMKQALLSVNLTMVTLARPSPLCTFQQAVGSSTTMTCAFTASSRVLPSATAGA